MPELDLGELQMLSLGSHLELRLTSSIKYYPMTSTQSMENVEASLLHGNAGHRFWLSPCMPFRLDITFHVQEVISREAHDLLQQALVCSVERPETWQRFGLHRDAVESSACKDTGLSICSVLLSPLEQRLDPASQLAHKLDQEVSPVHLKPPQGIHCLRLDSIHLTMHVSDHTHPPWPCVRRGIKEGMLVADDVPSGNYGGHQLKLERNEGIGPMLYSACRSSHEDCDGDGDEDGSWLDPIIRLFDAGIRCAISSHPHGLCKRIQITSQLGFKALDTIVPAVWARGYLLELSEKAKFVPTVSHALMSVALRQSTQSLLGRKFQQLQRKGHSTSPTVSHATHLHLWHMLHKATLKHTSGKRLQPLFLYERSSDEAHGPHCPTSEDGLLQSINASNELNCPEDIDADSLLEDDAVEHVQWRDRSVQTNTQASQSDSIEDELLYLDSQSSQDWFRSSSFTSEDIPPSSTQPTFDEHYIPSLGPSAFDM